MKGRDVTKAVITVPAYFESRQKEATVQAAEKAGLEVLMLIAEPTAAAIALAVKQNEKNERIIMIYDLGGGKHLTIRNNDVLSIKVLSTSPSLKSEMAPSTFWQFLGTII